MGGTTDPLGSMHERQYLGYCFFVFPVNLPPRLWVMDYSWFELEDRFHTLAKLCPGQTFAAPRISAELAALTCDQLSQVVTVECKWAHG